jgi:hypothetical protein
MLTEWVAGEAVSTAESLPPFGGVAAPSESGRMEGSVNREFFCIARGKGEQWEALCLDLDIAVQGQSFDEVRNLLREAVSTYVQDALAEAEPARSTLLGRQVPFFVRFLWAFRFFRAALFGRKSNGDSPVWLPVACHA